MKEKEFKSIDIEGGDHVGKGDAVINIAQEYSEKGIDTTVISLPYYSTPIGYTIRKLISEGVSQDLEIEKDREVVVKMSLFALNRLEILNCILSEPREGIYLFDRGPKSNALTIAYSSVNKEFNQDINDLVDMAIDFDRYFVDKLDIDNCVIKLEAEEKEWINNRESREDLYEQKDVQEKSKEVYKIFESKAGDGWKNLITKRLTGWRSREEIKEEGIQFANERLGIFGRRYRERREPFYLGIQSIEKNLYKDSNVNETLKEEWNEAIKSNNKKDIYRLSELISLELVKSSTAIKWYNTDIKEEIKRILDIVPEVLYVFENMYGEEFLVKFLKSLND